jgi:hypothetical protein
MSATKIAQVQAEKDIDQLCINRGCPTFRGCPVKVPVTPED